MKLMNSSPILCLKLAETYTFSEMKGMEESLRSIAVNNLSDRLICLIQQEEISEDMKLELYFPVGEADLMQYSSDNFHVLPRTEVVSQVMKGDFWDISSVISHLNSYAKQQQREVTLPIRLIYRKDRSLFSSRKYRSEVQILLQEKETSL